MNENTNNGETGRLEISRLLALAGGIHHHVACAQPFLTGVPDPAVRDLLSGPAARVLKCERLSHYFQLSEDTVLAAFPIPDSLERLETHLRDRLTETQAEVEALAKTRGRIQGRLSRVVEEKAEAEARRFEAEKQGAPLRRAHQTLASACQDKESRQGPELQELRRRIRCHLKDLEEVRCRPQNHSDRSFQGPSARSSQEARLQTACQSLKAKLALVQADIKQHRARVEAQATEVTRAELELSRWKAQGKILARYEATLNAGLAEVQGKTSERKKALKDIVTALEGIKEARLLWPALEAGLVQAPRETRELLAQAVELVRFDDTEARGQALDLESALDSHIKAQAGVAGELARLLPRMSGLLEEFEVGSAQTRQLSFELDRLLSGVKPWPAQPMPLLRTIKEKIEEARKGLKKLRSRREKLIGAVARHLDRFTELERKRIHLIGRQKAVSDELIAQVRNQATVRGALDRRALRMHGQLASLFSGLTPLIGWGAPVLRDLTKAAVQLEKARELFQSGKINLANIHDRWSEKAAADTELWQTGLDQDTRVLLEKLSRQEMESGLVDRLARQYTACRMALQGQEKIRDLTQDVGRKNNEVERLTETQRSLETGLAKARSRVKGLDEERRRLAEDLSGARRQASGLAAHLQDELYPLVETLGLALFQSQCYASELRRSVSDREEEVASLSVLAAELEDNRQRLADRETRLNLMGRRMAGMIREKDRLLESRRGLARSLSLLSLENMRQSKAKNLEIERISQKIQELELKQAQKKEWFNQRLANLGQRAAVLVKSRGEAREKARRSGQEVQTLVRENEKLSRTLTRSQEKGLDLDRENAALKERFEAEMSRLDSQIAELKAQRQTEQSRLHSEIESLKNQTMELAEGKRQAQETNLALGQALTLAGEAQAERMRVFSAERARLEGEIHSTQDEVQRLEARIKAVDADRQIERASFKKRLGALSLQAADLEQGRKKADQEVVRLQKIIDRIQEKNELREKQFFAEKSRLVAVAKAWSERADRLKSELEEVESQREEGANLILRQKQIIQNQKNRLTEVMPLLSWFVDQVSLWGRPENPEPAPAQVPEGSEYLMVLIHMLRAENEGLTEKVGVLSEQRRNLAFENEHLKKSHQIVTRRLQEVQPLFQYYWQAWLKTTAALAESKTEALARTREIGALRWKVKNQARRLVALSKGLKKASGLLDEARADLARTGAEKKDALRLGAEYKELLEKSRAEAASLSATRARLRQILSVQRSAGQRLKDQNRLLSDQNLRLDETSRTYRRSTRDLTGQVDRLTRDLTEVRGRAETAWAALTHLNLRAGEVVDQLHQELAAQDETIRTLTLHLEEQGGRTVELERLQDRLAMLFWIMVKYGSRPEMTDTLTRFSQEPGFREAAALVGTRLHSLFSKGAGTLKNPRFRQSARQAVRRGFYSMLLAGGMVLAAPQEPSKATALPLELEPQKQLIRMIDQPPVREQDYVRGPVFCPEIDRTFEIQDLSPWEKAKGRENVQEVIGAEISAIARQLELPPAVYVRLIHDLYPKDQVLSVDDLRDDRKALKGLSGRFPNVFNEFKEKKLATQDIRSLLHLAGLASAGECQVWDRLYADFIHMGETPEDSLDMVMANALLSLDMKKSNQGLEFAGRLAPIHELERLSLEGFTRVIAPYFRAHVKTIITHPKYAYAHKPEDVDPYTHQLAQDIYVASEMFGVPRTIMISIAHQESYFANVLGDNSKSASPFQIYQPTKPYIIKSMNAKGLKVPGVPDHLEEQLTLATYMAASFMSDLIRNHTKVWDKEKPPLCDLDRVARSYNGSQAYPGEVYKKKMRLVSYLDRLREKRLERKLRNLENRAQGAGNQTPPS